MRENLTHRLMARQKKPVLGDDVSERRSNPHRHMKITSRQTRCFRLEPGVTSLATSGTFLIAFLCFALAGGMALGQAAPATTASGATAIPPPSAGAKRSAADLEKLAQPIALHPDPLIAMILPAAAYPLEIVQAARFVKESTNNVARVDDQPWDENVKGVAKFPELIAKMDKDLRWTMDLGQAFVDQPKELMDAIQELRRKAKDLGNLKSSVHQVVTVTNVVVLQTNITEVITTTREIIEVAPANPSVIYVPSYPSYIYYPWYPYYTYPAPLVSFGVGFAWGMFWGAAWGNHCNWGGGHVDIDIDIDSNRNINRNTDRNRVENRASNRGPGQSGRQQWKPDQNRMRQSGAKGSTMEARGWGSGGNRVSSGTIGSRPSTGTIGQRPATGNVGARPSTGAVGSRPSTGVAGSRPSTGNVQSRPSVSPSSPSNRSNQGSAFNRGGGGSSAWSSSNRGGASRGGGGYSRGGGGGFRGGGGGRRR